MISNACQSHFLLYNQNYFFNTNKRKVYTALNFFTFVVLWMLLTKMCEFIFFIVYFEEDETFLEFKVDCLDHIAV